MFCARFVLGFANTKDVSELAALVTKQHHGCGFLERDAKLTGLYDMHYYYCTVWRRSASFYLNLRMLLEMTCPHLEGSIVIKFGMFDSTLLVRH